VVLGCAVVAVLLAWRLKAARLPGRVLACWLASVAVFGVGVAIYDTLIYGGPLKSGYSPGEIQFTFSSISANFRYMPAHLIEAIPMLVPGLAGIVGIIWLWLRRRKAGGEAAAWIGLALAACWLAVWGLYGAYTWTAGPGLSTLQRRHRLLTAALRARAARLAAAGGRRRAVRPGDRGGPVRVGRPGPVTPGPGRGRSCRSLPRQRPPADAVRRSPAPGRPAGAAGGSAPVRAPARP
jgi:hypothetical protein